MKIPSLNIRSRSRMFQWLTGVSLLTAFAVSAEAQVNFTDDFETGNTVGAAAAGWTTVTGAPVMATNNVVPNTNPGFSIKTASSGDRTRRNIPATGANSFRITAYINDTGGARGFADFRSYSGGGYGSGALNQIIGFGKNNSVSPGLTNSLGQNVETYDSSKYQGRIGVVVLDDTGQPGTGSGYFNLNFPGCPSRVNGWHRFDIVGGGMDNGDYVYNYYVDGKLGRCLTNRTVSTPGVMSAINAVVAGFGAGSDAATFNYDGYKVVDNVPWVSTQPEDQSVTQGQPLTLSAKATGLATLTYQWQKNGANIAGATETTYFLSNADVTNAGNYTFIVSNSLDVITSRVAVVTVQPLIQILTPPQGTRINVGESLNLTVSATGSGNLSYQWKKDGTNLVGKTDSTLAINNAQVADRGSYTVVVTNDVGDPATTSSAAVLQVNTAPVVFSGNLTLTATTTPYEFQVPLTDDYSTNGTLFETFESYSNGQTKMFNQPTFSSSSIGSIDTNAVSFTRVTNSYPAGHAGTNVLKSTWSWTPGGSWLRFTTSGSAASFSPVISTNLTLHFDMYSTKDIYLAFMIRESNPTGALGSSNGGGSGALEALKVESGPNPLIAVHTPADYALFQSNAWRKVDFSIPAEAAVPTILSFSGGNNKIDSTTGKVVLESLIFNPSDTATPETIYLDNFSFVPADPVNFTLDAGPAGATIDPVTGRISWLPPGVGVYNFTVSAKDTGSFITPDSGLTGTSSFTVTIVNATPASPKLNYSYNSPNVTFTWTNNVFTLESASAVAGPWTPITGATTGFTTNTTSGSPKFFRLKY